MTKRHDLERLEAWADGAEPPRDPRPGRNGRQRRKGRKKRKPKATLEQGAKLSADELDRLAAWAKGAQPQGGGKRRGARLGPASPSAPSHGRSDQERLSADEARFRERDAERWREFVGRSAGEPPSGRHGAAARKLRKKAPSVALHRSGSGKEHQPSGPSRVFRSFDAAAGTELKPAPGFERLLDRPTYTRRIYSIGIDAGTSGIRIAMYDDVPDETRINDFGPNGAGGTRFSMPAVVGIDSGEILLGPDALASAASSRFVSFKAALLHYSVDQSVSERFLAAASQFANIFSDGIPTPADFLYAVTVGHAIENALEALIGSNAADDTAFQVSIGAPLDGSAFVARRFHRALASAVLLAGCIGSERRLSELVPRYISAWQRSVDLCGRPSEQQSLFVRNEALSAVRGVGDVLRQFGDNFLVADIGATTTDVAVIRIGIDRLACYAATSIPVGVDQVDHLLLKNSDDPDILAARLSRQARGASGAPQGYASAVSEVSDKLRVALQETLREAVRKNDDMPSWEKFNVVVAGGGSNIPELRAVFTRNLPHSYVRSCKERAIRLSSAHVVGQSTRYPEVHEAFELLSVLGSTRPVWEEIEFQTPDTVSVVVPTIEDPVRELSKIHYMQWV